MAIIKCKEYGGSVSDQASECPHCGAPMSEPNKGGNGKKLLIICAAVAVVAIAAFVGVSSHKKYVAERQAAAELAAQMEQARRDSIAEVERLIAVQDSIRRDSIERRNFLTPDLAFNDLHGHVKKYTLSSTQYDGYNSSPYLFDENGSWTNPPTWSAEDRQSFPDRTKKRMVVRNNDGYIVKIYESPECDYESCTYSWKNDKVVAKIWNEDECYLYTYNDNGDLIKNHEKCEKGEINDIYYTYSNYVYDDLGNWISRKVKSSWKDSYTGETGGETYTERRQITYYE